MFYSQARPRIRSGDMIAWRRTRRWIRAAGPSESWSQVGVAYWLEGRLMAVSEGAFTGVRMTPASRLLPFDWIRTYADLNAAATAELFGRFEAPGLVPNLVHAFWRTGEGRIGAAFAARVLQACGSLIGPVDTMTPSGLVHVLRHYQMPLLPIESDAAMPVSTSSG